MSGRCRSLCLLLKGGLLRIKFLQDGYRPHLVFAPHGAVIFVREFARGQVEFEVFNGS
jgi:hypothetical protein